MNERESRRRAAEGDDARREEAERREREESDRSLLPDGNANPSPDHEPERPARTTPY